MALFFTISGVRGIYGKDFDESLSFTLGKAFSTYKHGKIGVCRDTRRSGKILLQKLKEGLLSAGCDVVDFDIAPTPTLLLNVRELKLAGGVVVTASHNPEEWNGFKFVSEKGLFLSKKEIDEFYKIYESKNYKEGKGKEEKDGKAIERHINKIFEKIDVERIKEKGFKVGIDCCNGATSYALKYLLEKLNCEIYSINCELTGEFTRSPEPVPSALKDLCEIVKNKKLDVGFATDPDGDRLSIVDDKGRAIGEEYTFPLCGLNVIKEGDKIVTNLSTSRLIEVIADKIGAKVYRTAVGEANVVSRMLEVGAKYGGEGNGGVIYPEINFTRDSLTGVALILDLLTKEDRKLSEIVDELPKYYMMKEKIRWDKEIPVDEILEDFPDADINLEDGLWLGFEEGFLHVRKSNTEPVVRIICETSNLNLTKEIIEDIIKKFR